MNNGRNFSVIIATYTGQDTIGRTLDSLLAQRPPAAKYEVIVIVDGPNEELRLIADNYKREFENKKINFRVKQFKQNKGRFEARLEGAKTSSYEYILIVDDRVELPSDYLSLMSELGEIAAMPAVRESQSENFVSFTLGKFRQRLYGGGSNDGQQSFYIDTENFDRSAKGTTSLWIAKPVFLKACRQLAKTLKITTTSSDDTRLLRYVVESGTKIYKARNINIIYNPRSTARSELIHIYHRGPKFIDYYMSPGRRFFIPLVIFYASLIPIIIMMVFFPWLLLFLLAISLFAAVIMTPSLNELPVIWTGLCLIILAFSAGLIFGLARKLAS